MITLLSTLSMPFSTHEKCPVMSCALRLTADRPGLVLDVGANGGCEMNLALAQGRQVISVECLASAYWELLQEPRFRAHQNLTLLHACAGDAVNMTLLHLAAESSSVLQENVAQGPEAVKAHKAQRLASNAHVEAEITVPLDLLVPVETSVALIKVDVQGAEGGVLRGLRRTIERDRPLITFEYTANHQSYRRRWVVQGNV